MPTAFKVLKAVSQHFNLDHNEPICCSRESFGSSAFKSGNKVIWARFEIVKFLAAFMNIQPLLPMIDVLSSCAAAWCRACELFSPLFASF